MSANTAPIQAAYSLTDHHGRRVTETDFSGKYQLIFFGFTNCGMVCPRALAKLSGVLEKLGPLGERLQPLYITVDPERDTPDVMRAFLQEKYPAFLGLTGTPEECESARVAFKVFAAREVNPDRPDDYAVPHSALTYVLDEKGQYVTHFLDAADADRMLSRLRSILE
ncbi:protein SCO1/2 [Streptomyces sp. SAI-135]|uniref:SCO family protein n=1 Tax=unclassified Streptomyces TaxID=2593676 RepID=UPI0024740898|nr:MULTISPECIES: SCO family protein [unclassified Streptomyces]MDH6523070.1 protein SCO1/2 [Streptomyces sp. SAI-090]MDH6554682.1 protein SCO1/2 [Streptomyces sp. SAI-041]MDH6573953.1 protein SCO1/2 [Streptomyces sp. SAI-117]MDH6581310.1 protein SCO1/2 [Streptomyces sp. SAI-133]MDH6613317.1 protein SCO1/2 [Streptomyces sp. SAI-135]